MKSLLITACISVTAAVLAGCSCEERCADERLTVSVSPGGPPVTAVELVAPSGESVVGRPCDSPIDCVFAFDGLPGALESESSPRATLRVHTAVQDLEASIVWSMDGCDVLRPVGVLVSGSADAPRLDVSEGASCRER